MRLGGAIVPVFARGLANWAGVLPGAGVAGTGGAESIAEGQLGGATAFITLRR
jgi:hypothetical protein